MEINRGETRRGMHPESGPNPVPQSDVERTDINYMSTKHLQARMQGNPNGRKPMFIDVPSLSFHEMMNKVATIREDFASLPARIRGRFYNDPHVLLSFIEKPENRREAVRLGLIHDPELSYQMERERQQKAAQKVEQTSLVPQADPEAQPSYKAPKGPKTPSPS